MVNIAFHLSSDHEFQPGWPANSCRPGAPTRDHCRRNSRDGSEISRGIPVNIEILAPLTQTWHGACKRSREQRTHAMNLQHTPSTEDLPTCDTSRRFVRVLETRPDGLVSFEFSIGWPELAVELMLPAAAFDAFCANNRVVRLDA
jgi:phenol/toluene 2-monooxygenase (NADH) P0/A0